MINTLQALCTLDAVSGREASVRQYILSAIAAAPIDVHVETDALGNILCTIAGEKRPAKQLLLTAHMDEVGLIVTGITDEGYLHFATVGGIDRRVLCGRRVRIGNQLGIIGCKAVHLCKKEEATVMPEVEDLLIDIGVGSAEEAKKLVYPGDTVAFDTDFTTMQDLVMSKALDDRAGCTLLLQLLQEKPLYDFSLAFTVQEEVGTRGAGPAAFSMQPDIAVIVDATTAADIANVPSHKQVCRVGGGPVVSFMDKATVYDPALYEKIRHEADHLQISHQTKTLIAGGNDAGAIQRTAGGVQVAAVSLPCRYIHSPSSVLSMQDMYDTLALLKRLLQVLPK